jgi:hypothetical protein
MCLVIGGAGEARERPLPLRSKLIILAGTSDLTQDFALFTPQSS